MNSIVTDGTLQIVLRVKSNQTVLVLRIDKCGYYIFNVID